MRNASKDAGIFALYSLNGPRECFFERKTATLALNTRATVLPGVLPPNLCLLAALAPWRPGQLFEVAKNGQNVHKDSDFS